MTNLRSKETFRLPQTKPYINPIPRLTPRAPNLKEHHDAKAEIRKPKPKQNPLKAADVTVIDYKDVALLRKFISDRGKIRARRVTGVTVQEQRKIAQAIKNAREVALLPYSGAGR